MSKIKLYKGDCLKVLYKLINGGGIKVDTIIIDPPYLYLNHKLDRQFDEELSPEVIKLKKRLKNI